MKYNTKQWISATGLMAALTMSANVCATNGMFLIAPSTKSRGMGGATIAMPHDTVSSAVNPAILAHTGNRFDIGGDFMFIEADATLGQGANRLTVESKPSHFTVNDGIYMLPNLGASWDFGDMSYGFTMVGVGGGGSEYRRNLFNNVGTGDVGDRLGVSLLVMNINPTVAKKLNEDHSVGATLIIGVQVFKAFGLTEFTTFTATQDDTAQLTNKGAEISHGFGVRIGWLGEFMNDKLRLGAEFTSKTYMEEFTRYTDLFAEQGDIDTPGNIGVGAAYDYNDKLTVAADINYIMYEQVNSISNPGPDPGSATPFPVDRETNALGRDAGLGFGWTNQTVLKVGAIYQYDPKWVLRAGWNYGKSPIDENTEILFNITAPATTQHHMTFGGTYNIDKDMELSFSYIRAFEYRQAGPTYIGFEGEIGMSQHVVGATFASRF